jgi:hypothetical protein
MIDLFFWLIVVSFLGLRVYYYCQNKGGKGEWNRRHMEMESL